MTMTTTSVCRQAAFADPAAAAAVAAVAAAGGVAAAAAVAETVPVAVVGLHLTSATLVKWNRACQ